MCRRGKCGAWRTRLTHPTGSYQVVIKDFDLIITDLRMETPQAGLKVIEAARRKDLWTQVILVTAYQVGPEVITKGAYDYVLRTDPGNYPQRVQELIPEALEYRWRKQKEPAYPRSRLSRPPPCTRSWSGRRSYSMANRVVVDLVVVGGIA
ncbi:MAG: hypothetical protein LGR52_10950 [Candidatus Thiosymbion ectosymbiont of Robbea hypermnestra]|nr:hypothetical protein [Candidatus Thiosymbion ectosymbiont of Robbea hypermnestra]